MSLIVALTQVIDSMIITLVGQAILMAAQIELSKRKPDQHTEILLRYNGITTKLKLIGYRIHNQIFLVARYMVHFNPKFKVGQMIQ